MSTPVIRNALVSVSNKQGLPALATFLSNNNITIYSTGGTYNLIQQNTPCTKVSDLTNFPEIMNGRVKTLHPTIYGGILARRSNPNDLTTLETHNIPPIDLVVVNLYPFQETVDNPDSSEDDILENIDIGGPCMLRAAAKNFKDVVILTSPEQYEEFQTHYTNNTLTPTIRKKFALQAFQHVTEYDIAIANHFAQSTQSTQSTSKIYRSYTHITDLKYGLNPNQTGAKLFHPTDSLPPFQVLNGTLGYINVLDAVNAWGLVSDLAQYFPSETHTIAASYKHTSPAGVAYSRPLTTHECQAYNIPHDAPISHQASAFILARNCDPKSSFGDFLALSSHVDLQTAKLIKREVSDGIIAPSYDPEALTILKAKKGGKYIVLQSQLTDTSQPKEELRTYQNTTLLQPSNTTHPAEGFAPDNQVTTNVIDLSPHSGFNHNKDNLVLANATLKYTQSNSVAFARNGQCVVAAGQQNRVDCTRLAGQKLQTLLLRFHPRTLNLLSLFKPHTPRQTKVNALIQFLENDFTPESRNQWLSLFDIEATSDQLSPLSKQDIQTHLTAIDSQHNTQICLASDAFFPFEDNIDVAHQYGVKHIIQTGGSIRDPQVIERADTYGMSMILTGNRFFLH